MNPENGYYELTIISLNFVRRQVGKIRSIYKSHNKWIGEKITIVLVREGRVCISSSFSP